MKIGKFTLTFFLICMLLSACSENDFVTVLDANGKSTIISKKNIDFIRNSPVGHPIIYFRGGGQLIVDENYDDLMKKLKIKKQ